MGTIELFIVCAILGVGIGVLSGLLGIGGGTVMVPVFKLGVGLSALASTATSLFAIIPTSISGVITHLRNKTCVPKLGLALGLGGAVMSPVGVWLATISPAWMVMVVAAVVIGWSAVKMFRKALKPGRPPQEGSLTHDPRDGIGSVKNDTKPIPAAEFARTPSAGGVAEAANKETSERANDATLSFEMRVPNLLPKQLLQGVCIGLVAGLASGYVGVGGGFIMVPLMISIIGIPMRLASGTSLIAVMILAIPGTIEQALLGNINYTVGLAIVIGSIPGAVLGARLVKVVPERILRLVFGTFLLVAAVLLAISEFGVLG